MNEDQLQALLKARAQVQAPADYSQKLLQSLQERQRAVLLQKSLWRIASERISLRLSEHSISTPAYALGMAAVFALGLAAIFLLKPSMERPPWQTRRGRPPPCRLPWKRRWSISRSPRNKPALRMRPAFRQHPHSIHGSELSASYALTFGSRSPASTASPTSTRS
jgi:hypothetical protein